MACPNLRHYCDNKSHRQEFRPCGRSSAANVSCAKSDGHDGDHAGYGFSITQLVTWP